MVRIKGKFVKTRFSSKVPSQAYFFFDKVLTFLYNACIRMIMVSKSGFEQTKGVIVDDSSAPSSQGHRSLFPILRANQIE